MYGSAKASTLDKVCGSVVIVPGPDKTVVPSGPRRIYDDPITAFWTVTSP